MHALKRKKKGRRGALALELNMSKAYDKGLSRLFHRAKIVGDISRFRCIRQGPKTSHLFFTDDCMIFTKASDRDCHAIKRILEAYSKASSKVVNFNKSALCVSRRVSQRRARNCAQIIGVLLMGCHERYLGLPSFTSQLWFFMLLVLRSFMWGREIISKGSRWRIGDGSSVRIYSDRWIPRPTTSKVVSPVQLGEHATVVELKLPSGCGMNGLSLTESWWKCLWRMKMPAQMDMSFMEFILECRKLINSEDLEVLCISLWRAFHNSKIILADEIVPWAKAFHDNFRKGIDAKRASASIRCLVPNSWCPPDEGFFKANSNASLGMGNGKVGIGIIIRDYLGEVLASCSLPILVALALDVAEATAIFRGFIFASEAGLLPCTLESDAQVVVKLINTSNVPLSKIVGFEPLTTYVEGRCIATSTKKDIICFLDCHPDCKVVFAPRQDNMAAHNLAKLGLSLDADLFWLEETPSCVAPTVWGERPAQL
ncbi:hypothetical protein Dsin_008904 [Dipteronia sinensis]|uniref:RNase H type-1 domain-containing protein n=1 Tax=Dipteronia sinensis TaxID=43782 RepID=A0AAE0AQR4_9ROSI|nr:hypothetical protein Dsin_008904 [Dipteronia sinensis]